MTNENNIKFLAADAGIKVFAGIMVILVLSVLVQVDYSLTASDFITSLANGHD